MSILPDLSDIPFPAWSVSDAQVTSIDLLTFERSTVVMAEEAFLRKLVVLEDPPLLSRIVASYGNPTCLRLQLLVSLTKI